VRVRSPQAGRLATLLGAEGVTVRSAEADVLSIEGMTNEQIGIVASDAGITLYELTPQVASLEEAYMSLTEEAVAFRSLDARREDPRIPLATGSAA
jgi:ABC-2 type transport system ATP-binding protein